MEPHSETPDLPDFVEVANLPDTISAESVRACLEMEGVEARVFDGGISAMHGWLTNAFGGVKVKVPAVDLERARRILASTDLEVGDEVVPENEILDFSNPHCPRCHSLRIRTRSTWASPRSALMRLLTPFASTRVTLCKACGHAWRS